MARTHGQGLAVAVVDRCQVASLGAGGSAAPTRYRVPYDCEDGDEAGKS
jgi:hypothetical protein